MQNWHAEFNYLFLHVEHNKLHSVLTLRWNIKILSAFFSFLETQLFYHRTFFVLCDDHFANISVCGGQGPGFKSPGMSFTHIYT